MRGAAVVFFAYIGFDAVSTAAQEAKNPQRDMPIGILGSLASAPILYIAVGFVLTGIVAYDKLNVADPIAVGIDAIGLTWLAPFIKLGIILGLTSVILVLLLGQPRIFYAMARDRFVAAIRREGARAISERLTSRHIDHRNDCDDARRAAADRLGRRTGQHRHLVRFCRRMRRRAGSAHQAARLARPFRTPAVVVIAPLGALSALFLMAGLPLDTWLRFAVWLVIGLAIYLFYGIRHSRAAA